MRLTRPVEFHRPPTVLRPGAIRQPVRASSDRTHMRRRVEQECKAWQQKLDACNSQARAVSLREPRAKTDPALPPLATLDSLAGVAAAQLGIAQSKRQLLLSERDADVGSPPTFQSLVAATEAVRSLRQAGLPPIFPQHLHKLQGTWILMKPTAPHRFGDVELRSLTQGVSQWHPTAPGFVDVHAVARRFSVEGTFCESSVFVAAQGLRQGSFSVMGHFEVKDATAMTMFPTAALLTVDGITKAVESPPLRPSCLNVCYLDDDLMLQGRHDTLPGGVAVWGRDHAETCA